jgi:hypothetical protein
VRIWVLSVACFLKLAFSSVLSALCRFSEVSTGELSPEQEEVFTAASAPQAFVSGEVNHRM